MLTAARRRRSTRSATVPVTKTRRAAGANSARPIRPSASSLPVMSNTSLPSTVSRSAHAADAANTDDSRATIDRVSRCTGARYRRDYRDTVGPGTDEVATRRARAQSRAHRHRVQWNRFGVAVGVTVALVVL